MYVEPLTLVWVAPETLALDTPLLSLATKVNVTVLLWSLVLSVIEVADGENELITGSWVSLLVMVTLTVSVVVLPAASPIVTVSVLVDEPKLKSA